ncbi:hypothetical protein [Gracilibacillus saliphilus]|uniref:hypothetical protein n=1 Tax=Gracilibacillus saliphilus TaxID=543890 RepID=UPI0013D3AB31|nr:hypothetical protein [Gracilibacillus saliphilus]
MNKNYKSILLWLAYISLGLICGTIIFIPIFEDTFMGLFMGFVIGVGLWLSIADKKSN